MKIGILGSGDVGRRLGDGFIELGHMVKSGTRDPSKGEVVQWVSNHGGEEGKAAKSQQLILMTAINLSVIIKNIRSSVRSIYNYYCE